jgi:hypothetical protein
MSYRKAKGEAHIGKECDLDCSSSDSDDEGLAASAFNKSFLLPNERHTCLMEKEKKVSVRETPKYTTSSDDESSDDEVDYTELFKGLDRSKVDKINELIDAVTPQVLPWLKPTLALEVVITRGKGLGQHIRTWRSSANKVANDIRSITQILAHLLPWIRGGEEP